jgi:hypothetical protein
MDSFLSQFKNSDWFWDGNPLIASLGEFGKQGIKREKSE